MFRFRRSDAFMRNAWTNYTNWPYSFIPNNISQDGSPDPTQFLITGDLHIENEK